MRKHSRVAVGSPTARILVFTMIPLLLLLLASVAVTVAVQPTSDTDDWPTLLGDFQRTGVAEQGPVGRPVIRWQSATSGPVNNSPAIVHDLVLAPSSDGLLHALSLSDGVERWTYPASNSGVTVIGDTAFVADVAGVIHAVDLRTGEATWQSDRLSTPGNTTFGDGRLYAGTQAGEVVALDPENGKVLWLEKVADGSVNGVAFKDGRVFAGSDGLFIAVDGKDGTVDWSAPTANEGSGTPRLGDDIAFLSASSSAPAARSNLRAFDIDSGDELWSMPGQIFGPVLSDGVGYAPGQGLAMAFALDTGQEHWTATFDGVVRGMALAAGVLYVPVIDEQTLYALDAATGAELWRFATDGGPTNVAVAGGVIYVGTDAGWMYAIEGDETALMPGAIPSAAVVTPTPVPSPAPPLTETSVTAEFLWEATSPDGSFLPTTITQAPDGNLWVTDAINDRFAVFTSDGAFVEYWGESGNDVGQFHFQRDNGDWYGGVAFAPDGSFFTLDAGNRRVQHFHQDRRLLASWGGPGAGPGRFISPTGIDVGSDGSVYVLDEARGLIERYDAEGNVIGTLDPFQGRQSGFATTEGFAVDRDGNAYASLFRDRVVVRVDPTGAITGVFGKGVPSGLISGDGLSYPNVDPDGRLFVSQGPSRGETPAVLVFDPDGTYLGGWGQAGNQPGNLVWPTGASSDDQGNIYVGDVAGPPDFAGPRVQKFHVEVTP